MIPTQPKRAWLAPLLVVMVAFLLRISGLSHDLDAGNVYHPDTAKQIHATERFIEGKIYVKVGARDYDGYPYFNSLLVAGVWNAYQTTRTLLLTHIGTTPDPIEPTFLGLFWLTRFVNATTSALTVLVVFWIGATAYHRRTGLIAASLLALSPIDITASHFATGDSTTAFLAALSVLFAFRIARDGRYRDYAFAALCAAAATSTKYHGGIAMLAALIAHLSRYPRPRHLFCRASIGRLGLLVISGLIGFVLTTPALLVHPEAAFKDILQFLGYTSSFGMTSEMMDMTLTERFELGMSLNMPLLLDIIGPFAACALLLAFFAGILRAKTWMIAIVPLAYILLGLATKPLTHPIYHTLATPGLLLLAAIPLGWLLSTPRVTLLARPVGGFVLLAALAYSATYSWRELFFFNRNDTRLLAQTWATDNIPESIRMITRNYTFDIAPWSRPEVEPEAIGIVLAEQIQPPTPQGTFPAHTVSLEDQKLIVFRNWNIFFFLPESRFSPLGFYPPVQQPLPASHPDDILFTDAPWLVGTPKVREVRAPECKGFTLVADHPISGVLVSIQAGATPLHLRLMIGGIPRSIRLGPAQSTLISVDTPWELPLTRNRRHFVPAWYQVTQGTGRLLIATTDSEKAWMNLHAGNVHTAHNLFDRDREPLGYALSGILSGRFAPEDLCSLYEILLEDTDHDAFFARYGIHPDLFTQLPGRTWSRHDLPALVNRVPNRVPPHEPDMILEPDIILEPGRYTLTAEFDAPIPEVALRIATPWDQTIQTFTNLSAEAGTNEHHVRVSFDIDRHQKLVTFFWDGEPQDLASLSALRLQADVPGTAALYRDWLGKVADGAWHDDAIHPLHHEFFLILGDHHALRGDWESAYRCYQSARIAAPERRAPYQRLADLAPLVPTHRNDIDALLEKTDLSQPAQPVSVRYAHGFTMTSVEQPHTTLRPGDDLALNFTWEIPCRWPWTPRIPSVAVWIHGIRKGETEPSFTGNRYLIADLAVPRSSVVLQPYHHLIELPVDLRPGTYTLKAGLWLPDQRRNLRVRESDLPADKRGAFIGTLDIITGE